MKEWQVIRRQEMFSAKPWFSIHVESVLLPDGRIIRDYYQINQRDYVEILALNGDGRILGLWRYKHGPRRVNLGLPAGYLEESETPLAAAERELREECGLRSNEWMSLGTFTIDGNRGPAGVHVCLAYDCRETAAVDSDDLEEARMEWLTPEQWKQHIFSGEVATMGVAVSILLGLEHLSRGSAAGSEAHIAGMI